MNSFMVVTDNHIYIYIYIYIYWGGEITTNDTGRVCGRCGEEVRCIQGVLWAKLRERNHL